MRIWHDRSYITREDQEMISLGYRSCSSVIRISSPQWAQEMSCGNCCEAV